MTVLLFFIAGGSFCYADDGRPKLIPLVNDTIPAANKIPETKTDNSSTVTTIKEVPKAKKQLAPIAVPVQVKVKPIKIIKPKIIKTVIKIN